jgi:hypothetical protein
MYSKFINFSHFNDIKKTHWYVAKLMGSIEALAMINTFSNMFSKFKSLCFLQH